MVNGTLDSDKKEKIIKAAVKVFSKKGFHGAKVDEIAQLADVGKGTVYEYFSSKAELFQEMFKSGMKFYEELLIREIKPDMTCKEKLVRMARLHLKFIDRYKDLAKIMMTEHSYFEEDFRKWAWQHRENKMNSLKEIIGTGIEKGEFRQLNPASAAFTYMGCLGGLIPSAIMDCYDQDMDVYKLLDEMLDLFFNGLAINESVL